MLLTIQCSDCQKKYSFSTSQKPKNGSSTQSDRCPKCERNHQVQSINNEINLLQAKITSIRPTLCQLNQVRQKAKKAYLDAEADWETLARKYSRIDRKLAIITHERDLLINPKKRTRKPAKTPEEKSMETLKNLPEAVREAVLKQLKEHKKSKTE